MPEICVIVPYHQSHAGHLARALRSALHQQSVEMPQIIVVDDGSPLPASQELDALDREERARVTLLRQANRGPGPARNAALDAVPPGCRWIALLDSDDFWEPSHLARAIAALGEGFDFVFSDSLRDGSAATHFALAGLDPSAHRPLATGLGLFGFSGDFFTATLRRAQGATSTVVMSCGALASLRFPPLRDGCEDLIFWLDIARATDRIAFDGTVQARLGAGGMTLVEDWTSAKALRNGLAYARYLAEVSRRFALSGGEAALLAELRAHNGEALARIVIAMLRRGRWPGAALLRSYLRLQPTAALDVARVLWREGTGHVLGMSPARRSPTEAGGS